MKIKMLVLALLLTACDIEPAVPTRTGVVLEVEGGGEFCRKCAVKVKLWNGTIMIGNVVHPIAVGDEVHLPFPSGVLFSKLHR